MKHLVSRTPRSARRLAVGLGSAAALLLTGCGAGSLSTGAHSLNPAVALQGRVFGGQQPVGGSILQLYAANLAGYGLASTPLIAQTVVTDSGGNFSITGTYTCPYPTSQVYITATGGNSGSGTNPNLAMMASLGACGNLSAATNVNINELTTVATAYAFAPFMSSPTQLSTSGTNVTGLTNAAATVNKLVNTGNGTLPGPALPAGATAPTALLNTLADILASCINSGGLGSPSTSCSTLFTNSTTPGGAVPADTITAMLNIAKYPSTNAAALFLLTPANAPFQPTLTSAPSAYTVALRYVPTGSGVLSTPSASAVDSTGNLWVTNAGNDSLSVFGATTGTPVAYAGGGLSAPYSIAFDAYGNAWVPNRSSSTLSVFAPTGTGNIALNTNLSKPSGVAIDGQGTVWVTNSTGNSITAVTTSRNTVTGSTVYPSVGGTTPVAVAINPR